MMMYRRETDFWRISLAWRMRLSAWLSSIRSVCVHGAVLTYLVGGCSAYKLRTPRRGWISFFVVIKVPECTNKSVSSAYEKIICFQWEQSVLIVWHVRRSSYQQGCIEQPTTAICIYSTAVNSQTIKWRLGKLWGIVDWMIDNQSGMQD